MTPLPPLPLVDGCLFIDNSGFVESTNTCYRKYEYAQLRKRILAGEQPALTFGSALHLALEYRYVKAQNQRVEPWIDEEVATLLTDLYAEHPTPEGDWRTLNWAVELFKKYNERYSIEEFQLLKYDKPVECPYCSANGRSVGSTPENPIICPWCSGTGQRPLMVEMSFALPLYTHEARWSNYKGHVLPIVNGNVQIPVIYTGRIDLPISLEGRLYILDHKTTGLMGPSFFDRMMMATQMRGYCWAFRELTGQMPAGYVVNGIRTKEPPQYVTSGDTGGSRKYQSPAVWWSESFQRERYYVDTAKLDEWKQNTITKVEEFFWHYSRGSLPTNSESCTKYNMRCPFFRCCELEASDRLTMLNSGDYVPNTWTPLKAPSL